MAISVWVRNVFAWRGWNAVAALATLLAAIAAFLAAEAASDAPRRQAVFEARHQALRDYTQAEGQLHAILIVDPLYVSFDLRDASTFNDEQKLRADAPVARATVDKYYAYATAANMSRSVWSSDRLEDAIRNAGSTANIAVACYKDLTVYEAATAQGVLEGGAAFRSKMQQDCSRPDDKTDAFDDASNGVIAMMINDMDSSWSAKLTNGR